VQIDYPRGPRLKKAASSADAVNILTFVNAAFRDYLAARVLLLSGLTVQGAVLASTAIEKYLKALLAFRGNRSHGHLKRAHLNAFKNYSPRFYAAFNEEFLLFLQKLYPLRYPDSLPKGFNVVIARREFLAELDDTAIRLNASFQPKRPDDKQVETLLDKFLAGRDDRLMDLNHVLNRIDKATFVTAETEIVYEMRVLDTGEYLELEYGAKPRPSDGRFLREGIRPSGFDRGFLTAFGMIMPEASPETDRSDVTHPTPPSGSRS
jgi:HEPN domain-containing protein